MLHLTSRNRFSDDYSADTCDAFFQPLVEERQAFVVEAHEVQDCGVQSETWYGVWRWRIKSGPTMLSDIDQAVRGERHTNDR